MAAIHSKTLFHFTSRDGLLGILRTNFEVRFVKERLVSEGGAHWDYRVPAVCFCDIPLHLVFDHIEEYGQYGLGLSREWALSRRLNPVFYYQRNSLLFSQLSSMMSIQHRDLKAMFKNEMGIVSIRDAYFKNRYILQYYKPWYGYDFKLQRDKYFYDEREWRYVPTARASFEAIYDDNEEFQQMKDEYRATLEEPLLVFEPKDINYIVLSSEAERYEVAREIRDIKGKFSLHDVETLVSKILTVEQIQNDI